MGGRRPPSASPPVTIFSVGCIMRPMPLIALTRAVPDSMDRCELTHLARAPIDIDVARRQHAAYEDALRRLGCRVERIEPLPNLPDSVFVEDAAIVLEELAIATRPGASSRRAEVESVANSVARYRKVVMITEPATIDGGDVLRVGKRIFVGVSSRTNPAAVEQLRRVLQPYGYDVVEVNVRGVLHLKSAVTQVGPSQLLANRKWIDEAPFTCCSFIDVDGAEPGAANALLVGSTALFPAAFPRTRRRLEDAGISVLTIDASELAKAEGALTCCSILVDNR